MKVIDVKNQVRLSMAKCIELVLSGVRFRLFRAAITVLIIALAATFLMTMLGESIIVRQVANVIDDQTAPRRNFLFWANRISSPMRAPQLTALLAEGDARRLKEFQTWGGLSGKQMQVLRSLAARQLVYLDYFARLGVGERRPLVGSARGTEVFVLLLVPEKFERFRSELRNVLRQMPTDPGQFQAFLQEWDDTRPLRKQILEGHERAVKGLAALLGDRTPKEVLGDGQESFRRELEQCGFVIPAGQFREVSQQAALARDAERIGPLVTITRFKKELSQRTGIEVKQADSQAMFNDVRSTSGAAWLVQQVGKMKEEAQTLLTKKQKQRELDAQIGTLRKAGTDPEERKRLESERAKIQLSSQEENLIAPASRKLLARFSLAVPRIVEVARYEQAQWGLNRAEAIVAGSAGLEKGFLGFPVRTMWLLVVSFVVCVVGIVNAMLMSVTERFQEIATMKCLGATDGFIMLNFILESVMQGIAGGVIGTALGFVLGTLRGWARYGQIAMEHFPLLDMGTAALLSLGIGVAVSALAAVYPAWVAARLAPMEAMRIE